MLRTQIEVSDLFFEDITWYRPIEMEEGVISHIDIYFQPLLDAVRELVTDKEPVACIKKNSTLYRELLAFYGTDEMIRESSRVIYETSDAVFMYVREDEEFFSIVHTEGEEPLFIRFLLHGALSGECEYFKVVISPKTSVIIRAADKDTALSFVKNQLLLPTQPIEVLSREENNALFDQYFNFKPESPTLVLPPEALDIIKEKQNA